MEGPPERGPFSVGYMRKLYSEVIDCRSGRLQSFLMRADVDCLLTFRFVIIKSQGIIGPNR